MAGERPTLDTVALAAGVSRMTVSNAYNRPDQLSVATREKVMATAARLGYAGPDPTAASLRLRRTRTVGVVLTEQLPYAFVDPGMVTILQGIATELSEAGSALLLVPAEPVEGESLVRSAMVDALVLCSLAVDDPAVAAARERHIPLVTVGHPHLPRVPTVGVDNRATAAMVARHLLELGHRRFAVLVPQRRGLPRPGFAERADGFQDAVAKARPRASVQLWATAGNSRAAGVDAVRDGLAGPDRPTAIFAVTDILAFGALDAAAAAGLGVPADLSVAGYDDVSAAATSTPPLTTIAHDLLAQGRAAARLALRLAAGESVRAPRIRAELVVRASTGRAPGSR